MNVRRIARFSIVGVANTVIDFGLFNLMLVLGVPRAPANVLAVSAAILFSYFANRSFTFGQRGSGLGSMPAFVAVTAVGMAANTAVVAVFGNPGLFPDLAYAAVVVPNAAKVLASGVSLVWNYLCYSRFVFRDRQESSPDGTPSG